MADLTKAQRRELASQLRDLDAHPGWRLLVGEFERRAEAEIKRVSRGGLTHEEYGRASALIHLLRDLPKLPSETAEVLAPTQENARV